MVNRNRLAVVMAVCAVLGGALSAEAKMFRTVAKDPKNVIQFTSQATLETVVGKTSVVTGHVDLNLDSVAATTDGGFSVDLNTLDTGIGMRNNDMRKDFLETAKFPQCHLQADALCLGGSGESGFGADGARGGGGRVHRARRAQDISDSGHADLWRGR